MSKLSRSLVLAVLALLLGFIGSKIWELWHVAHSGGAATVASRVREFKAPVARRLGPDFKRAGVPYPPARLVLVGLKQERRLELYAAGKEGPLAWIRSYPILAASGHLGPKLREGDLQVPEGLYGIEYLNPNSSYHLSLKVSYPNAFDREQAARENRTQLGGDIMIHGEACSVGCLAMGNEAAEDLFVLAALTGVEPISVILSPVDFRVAPLPRAAAGSLPTWTPRLYLQIQEALRKLPRGAGQR
ncbi:MAG: murein L,D-transpeptidase family protein [Chthoniobacteraceae bacterium]